MPFVPGRIEVLGKHTDYCGGESIVCPIDRGFRYEFEPRKDPHIVLTNLDRGETVEFDLNKTEKRGGWGDYAIEVMARLKENFGEYFRRGVNLEFRSDLPPAAGLSSSSALMIMIFNALSEANDLGSTDTYRSNIADELDLAEYLGCIENGQTFRGLKGSAGVGTFGGSQDHAAIIVGRECQLTRFAFGPLRKLSEVAFPDEFCFVIASSGVVAEKTGVAKEKYNRASGMASAIAAAFGGGRTLAQLIEEIGIDELERLIRGREFSYPTGDLLNRVRQFNEESFEIIPAVSNLIEKGRIEAIGELVDRSQSNAEKLLGNQVEETIFLQRSARDLGAIAASAFGAGFGGSVYAMIAKDDVDAFTRAWGKSYRARFPDLRSEFLWAPFTQ